MRAQSSADAVHLPCGLFAAVQGLDGSVALVKAVVATSVGSFREIMNSNFRNAKAEVFRFVFIIGRLYAGSSSEGRQVSKAFSFATGLYEASQPGRCSICVVKYLVSAQK